MTVGLNHSCTREVGPHCIACNQDCQTMLTDPLRRAGVRAARKTYRGFREPTSQCRASRPRQWPRPSAIGGLPPTSAPGQYRPGRAVTGAQLLTPAQASTRHPVLRRGSPCYLVYAVHAGISFCCPFVTQVGQVLRQPGLSNILRYDNVCGGSPLALVARIKRPPTLSRPLNKHAATEDVEFNATHASLLPIFVLFVGDHECPCVPVRRLQDLAMNDFGGVRIAAKS